MNYLHASQPVRIPPSIARCQKCGHELAMVPLNWLVVTGEITVASLRCTFDEYWEEVWASEDDYEEGDHRCSGAIDRKSYGPALQWLKENNRVWCEGMELMEAIA